MSIGSPEEALYTNPEAFAKHYPVLRCRFGFQTAGQTMGLASDLSVPEAAKWGYWARHYRNMRFRYPPNEGYQELLSLTAAKDTFVCRFMAQTHSPRPNARRITHANTFPVA